MATLKSTVQVLRDRKAMLENVMSQVDTQNNNKQIPAVPKTPVSPTKIKPVK
jgi:hypothetical protein